MNKYDRDVWHDAETVPLWFIILITAILSAVMLLAVGCQEKQLESIDRIVADANNIVATGGLLLESPAGRMLPPDIQLYGAVGIALASIAVNGWQKVKGVLMTKVTRAIVKGIEAAETETKTNPTNKVKAAVKVQLVAAGIYNQGDDLIRRLKIAR